LLLWKPFHTFDHFCCPSYWINMALYFQVTTYDSATGLPLIQLWSMGDGVCVNQTLVERGFAQWIDNY
uniref:Uncharacterized protein n=1 Tax=Sphenodon punctatus TaxID=8508 RepID=A0A8D0GHW4_SPHPU